MDPAAPNDTLNDILLRRLDERGRDLAYHKEEAPGRFRPVYWTEARRRVLSLAAAIREAGLERGDRVAILSEVRSCWVDADFANLVGGTVTVGIYPTLPPDQVRYILDHAEVRLLFVETPAQLEALAPVLAALPNLRRIVLFDGAPPPSVANAQCMDDFLDDGGRRLDKDGEEPWISEARLARPEDTVTIVYTSGTTGPPKGARLSHRNLAYVTRTVASLLDLGPADRSIVYLPLAHILQRYTIYLGLHLGLQAWYSRDLKRLPELLGVVRPTVLAAVPRVLEKIHARALATAEQGGPARKTVFDWAMGVGGLASAAAREGRGLRPFHQVQHRLADRLVLRRIREKLGGSLRWVVSGGAPLAPSISEWFHAAGVLVMEGYGLTETSAPATTNLPDAFRFGTVGKPIPGTSVRIAEDGEVIVRGPGVFGGYWKDAAATGRAIDAEGWFRTGDVGEIDADGYLRLTDRKKDILITAGGKNVPPANIEGLLKEHPLIGQALVAGDRKPYLVALITLDPEEAPLWAKAHALPQDLAALAQEPLVQKEVGAHVAATNARLARYETIKAWSLLSVPFTVDNGLLTPTMKVKRREILHQFGDVVDQLYRREAPQPGE